MSLTELSLVRPGWLAALVPLALLWWRLWRSPDAGEAPWRALIDAHLLPHLLVVASPRRRRAALAWLAAALVGAVLALAGPALKQPQPSYLRDVTRVLVVELSPDMRAQLEQVKVKLLALLAALPEGQTALLVYGGEPYLVVPPTPDNQTIALFVPDLASEAIPVPGNRPDRALRMAGQVLARSTSRQRDIVWISATAPALQWPLAELSGVALSVLHLGATEEPALAGAAQRSGGVWVRLSADDADVRQLVAALTARGAWTRGTDAVAGEAVELGYWLLPALLVLAAPALRRGLLTLLLTPLLLGALLTPQPAAAGESPLAALRANFQAWRLLQAGQAKAAAERFADPRWRAAAYYRAGLFGQAAALLATEPDADSHYNRGNALAKQGQLTEALAAFETALELRADDADTLHNRDLVRRLLQRQSETPRAGSAGEPPQASGSEPKTGPPPPAPEPPRNQSSAEREAEQVAGQWLRGIADQPGSLLQRKLQAEQRRRQSEPAGEAGRAW